MMTHFDSHILSKILPCFFPLKVCIIGIWRALIPQRETMASVWDNTTTTQDITNVLKAVLQDGKLINAHLLALLSILRKCSAPGNLFVGSVWDPAKEFRTLQMANTRVALHPQWRTRFMDRHWSSNIQTFKVSKAWHLILCNSH